MREDHKGVVTERNEEKDEEEDLEKIVYVKYWYRDDNAVFSMFLMSNGSLQVRELIVRADNYWDSTA